MSSGQTHDKTYIVLPAYNEGRIISDSVNEIQKKTRYPLVIIEDGSTDDTYAKLLKIPNVTVIQHIINRGKGAALTTGIEAARMLGATRVVTMDSDGQHDPDDIPAMIKALDDGADVALGSRLRDPRGMPFIKIVFNKISNFLTWLAYGLWVNDSLSGFRAYSDNALKLIKAHGDRYQYDTEIIREIKRNKLVFKEVPIHVRYTKHSMTKKDKVNLKEAIKITINMFMPD